MYYIKNKYKPRDMITKCLTFFFCAKLSEFIVLIKL